MHFKTNGYLVSIPAEAAYCLLHIKTVVKVSKNWLFCPSGYDVEVSTWLDFWHIASNCDEFLIY